MAEVGAIATLNANVQILAALTNISGPNANPLLGNINVPPLNAGLSQQYQNITSANGILNASQIKYYALAPIAGSGTHIEDLSAASANLLGNAAATFGTGLKAFFLCLPAVGSQLALQMGITVQASSITVGNTVSTQFLAFFTNAASSIDLFPGDIVGGMRTGAATVWTIGSSVKSLLFTNNDAGVVATPVILSIGS